MCGRFLLKSPLVELQRAFGFAERPNLGPRFNIAPTQTVAIVRLRQEDGGGRELALVRWGLVPPVGQGAFDRQQDDQRPGGGDRDKAGLPRRLPPASLPGARGRLLRVAEARGRRPQAAGAVRRRDRAPFAFAGLWERWRGLDGPLDTCTIVTTAANALLAPIHDRMPVILDPADHDAWLDPARPNGEGLLRSSRRRSWRRCRCRRASTARATTTRRCSSPRASRWARGSGR